MKTSASFKQCESGINTCSNHEMMVASHCPTDDTIEQVSFNSFNCCEGYSSHNSGPNNTSCSSSSSSAGNWSSSNNSTVCPALPNLDARSKKLEQITSEQIQLYFGHTQTDAARLLGVSVSTLKRRFYELNLGNRRPYKRTKHTLRKNKKSPTFHENIASQMMNVMIMKQYDGGLVLRDSKEAQHCDIIKQTSPMIAKPKKMEASLNVQSPRLQSIAVSPSETHPKRNTTISSPKQCLSKLSLSYIMNPIQNDELR